MKPVIIAPLVALALAAGGAGAYFWLTSGGSTEEVVRQPTPTPEASASATVEPAGTATPSPAPEGQLWRWVNVTVVVPKGSPVSVGRGMIPSYIRPEDGPGMDLTIDHGNGSVSYVGIDAVTGEVVIDEVAEEDRPTIDQVLRTLAVSPFDTAANVWPYSDQLPSDSPRDSWGGLSYVLPDPASGTAITVGISDSFGGANDGPFIEVTNGRSTMQVSLDSQTGALSQQVVVLDTKDSIPFDRYVSTIEICGRDVEC